MKREELIAQIRDKKSFLCIGLDADLNRLPAHLLEKDRAVLAFNEAIVEATQDLCVAYKINTAFYEARGAAGWRDLKDTLALIPENILTIADAKRADIGNTSAQYAKAFFEELGADALTLAPYMGRDSIAPFLAYPNKWSILLGLTSNPGSEDFQLLSLQEGDSLYEKVLEKASSWAGPEQLMFVVGATRPDKLAKIRSRLPDYFFLIPGVGAQGGSLQAVARAGMSSQVGLLVNSSRGIIYAGSGENFADEARKQALLLQQEMQTILQTYA